MSPFLSNNKEHCDHMAITMLATTATSVKTTARAKPGGVRAKGPAVIKLFHPTKPLCAHYGDQSDNKGHFMNCTIVQK